MYSAHKDGSNWVQNANGAGITDGSTGPSLRPVSPQVQGSTPFRGTWTWTPDEDQTRSITPSRRGRFDPLPATPGGSPRPTRRCRPFDRRPPIASSISTSLRWMGLRPLLRITAPLLFRGRVLGSAQGIGRTSSLRFFSPALEPMRRVLRRASPAVRGAVVRLHGRAPLPAALGQPGETGASRSRWCPRPLPIAGLTSQAIGSGEGVSSHQAAPDEAFQ